VGVPLRLIESHLRDKLKRDDVDLRPVARRIQDRLLGNPITEIMEAGGMVSSESHTMLYDPDNWWTIVNLLDARLEEGRSIHDITEIYPNLVNDWYKALDTLDDWTYDQIVSWSTRNFDSPRHHDVWMSTDAMKELISNIKTGNW